MSGVIVALALASCRTPPLPPPAPVPAGSAITLETVPVPLNPNDPAQQRIGAFTYAGGIAISSSATSRLHGLSDLVVYEDGRLLSVSDDGDLFRARIVLDASGRLTGLTDGELEPLKGPDGQPLQGKEHGDAEGVALFANGDRLVSFERDHRIWLYPASGGPPRPAPKPATLLPDNEGMEALAAYPPAGPTAYLVGAEEGEVWLCDLTAACRSVPGQLPPDFDFGLSAIAPFQGEAIALLHRAYDPVRGPRIILKVVVEPLTKRANARIAALLSLQAPLTRDNFEGLSAVARPDGTIRFYLLSDDNFQASQRTLLMAFDWKPGA